jgi:hypothetical protein
MILPAPFCLSQNTKDKTAPNVNLISALPKNVNEASGLELDRDNNLWTHNDGGVPVLYCIGRDGKFQRALHINGVNAGWEDLTQDDTGNFYIGAFGDNFNAKDEFKIYKIPNPAAIKEDIVNPETISYTYSDFNSIPKKNFDVDAFISFQNSLYIFTKKPDAKGYIRIYKLPSIAGSYTATLVDSIKVSTGTSMEHWITSACLSPDKKVLTLLFHDKIMLIQHFSGDQFSSGNSKTIELNNFSHKAGICFYEQNKVYVVDELEFFLGGNLYSIDLAKAFID